MVGPKSIGKRGGGGGEEEEEEEEMVVVEDKDEIRFVCLRGWAMSSKWVIGRRELPLSHHGATIFSEQVRSEWKETDPYQFSSVQHSKNAVTFIISVLGCFSHLSSSPRRAMKWDRVPVSRCRYDTCLLATSKPSFDNGDQQGRENGNTPYTPPFLYLWICTEL